MGFNRARSLPATTGVGQGSRSWPSNSATAAWTARIMSWRSTNERMGHRKRRTSMSISVRSFDTRFWLRVWPRGDCWEWRGTRNQEGYGQANDNAGDWLQAHHYAFTVANGSIPSDLVLDHLCCHPWCVRPSHMVPVTPRANTLRGSGISARNASKTHCKYSHPLVPENIYRVRGGRECLACKRYKRRSRYQMLRT